MNEEVKEGGLLPLTPETANLEGDVGQNFAGKISARVTSTLSKNEQKILPRYLSASTGSCHDFCKYGRHHTFESEGKRPAFRRLSGSNQTPEKEQSRVNILSLADRQKKTPLKQKAPAHLKTELSDRPTISEEKAPSPVEIVECTDSQIVNHNSLFLEKTAPCDSSEIVECNSSPPSEKIKSLEEFQNIEQGTPVERVVPYEDPETTTQKATTSLEKSKLSEHPETANKKKPSVKKIHLSKEPASVDQRTQSTKKISACVKSKVKQKAPSPVKAAISPGLPKASKKDVSLGKRLDATGRPSVSGKPKIRSLKNASQQNSTTGAASIKNKSKGVKNVELSNPRKQKILRPPSASLTPQPPQNQVSELTKYATPVMHPRKVEKAQTDFDEIKEKTLYVVEPRSPQNKSFESPDWEANNCWPSLSSSSSSSLSLLSPSPSVSDYKGEQNQDVESAFIEACSISEQDGAKTNKAGNKSQRKTATVHPERKDPSPHWLRFRRGKVIDPQSDNSGPRRLRFRQGRMVGDDRSGKSAVEKRSFRRKQSMHGDASHPGPEAPSVVLRHQDVQDKKDAPDLFNQIIEETASKLVETRKSKVKALVGAFETVISLQESKPAASV